MAGRLKNGGLSSLQKGHHTIAHNEPKLEVVMATDAGGWNVTTNRLMAAHLARDPRLRVRAFVPKNTNNRHELASLVELLEDARFPGFAPKELLEYPSDKLKQVDFLIMDCYSHSLVEQAEELCKALKCKLIHVDHDDWGEFLNFFHGDSKKVCRAEQQRQLELCKKADLVVTIGPKIAQSFRNALQTQGKDRDIISITPGIHELGASKKHEGRKTFYVLVVAEYSNLTACLEIKGCDIAIKAILLLNDPSYHIIFAVKSIRDPSDLTNALLQRGLQLTRFSIKSIADDGPHSFATFINEVDVFILPSRVEGFGMGGLYAISANLPVLVSGNAGLGVALEMLLSGSKHVVHSNDPDVWADKIKGVREKGHRAFLEAEQLRQEYMDKFSWDNQCDELVEKMIVKDVPAEILARGPLAIKAYNKAVEQGKTRVMRLPIMLIGQERSGKTSLKKSLRGQHFNEKEGSTDAIKIDPSYFSVSTEMWSTGEANKESNAESAVALPSRVAELMVTDLMGTGKHAIFSSESENRPGAGSSSDTNSAESKETEAISEPDSSPKEIGQNEESFGKAESGAENLFGTGERKHLENMQAMQNVPDATAACVEKLLQEFEKKEENIYSVLWDFGGQSVYYTTHPLFLTPKAIYLLVYDLTKNPHDKASPIVKQGTFKQKEDRYCRKTNEDYLHLWLSSVFSLVRKDWESFATGKLPERLPPVILVCTHADKCARAKDLAREIYGSLLCPTKPYSAHLSKTYFVVDNTKSGSDDECPEVQRLRNEVREVAKQLPQLKESIPIKWLRFEEALRLKKDSGEPFISRDEARRVASNECGIDDDQQFNTLLNFLHDQRIVIHFDDTPELEKMVVLDPQWLIDLFRKVITVKPYDPTTDEEQFKELWQKLENEGILDDKLLQTMWKLNKEAADSLVAVMEKFSLLCNWPSAEPRKQYLVPSMLMCPPDEASTDLLVTDLIPPLFLRFTQLHSASGKRHTAAQQYVQVPLGLFPRLVIKLVQWCIKEELGPLFRRMYQNLARFPIRPKGYSAVLLCHSSSIEIVIHRDPKFTENTSKVAIGCMVRSVLESILQRIRDEFFWLRNMEYEFCVLCPLCCNHRSVSYCHEHDTSGCEREECLHFWSEYELQMQGEPFCTKNTLAGRTVVPVEEFAPWFGFSAKQQQFDSELLCSFGDSLVKDAVVAKVRVMDELACRLDQPPCHGKRELSLTQYWVHLAEEFRVPEDVVMRCQHHSENSPTRSMLEFLEGRDPHFKVQYLKNELGEINRNDLVEKLEKCSLQDTATIRNLREDNPETLDSICLHMDHSKNWQTLGRRLDIPNETLQQIATSSSCTETILDLIEKRNPQLTVKDIEAALTEVQRNDVCVVLKKHLSESSTIADLRRNLDCLDEVAALLDKETPGVKNWLHFARKFGVSKDDCDHMKPKGNPSPTKMVMEYLVQVNPQLTLKQFIETLMKMQRKDVVCSLKKFF